MELDQLDGGRWWALWPDCMDKGLFNWFVIYGDGEDSDADP